ncbi:MAG: urease accessory protein UreF [Acidimicrobiales bacterium]|nr:MAG: urease accessory protein UreF [Acidimicrobiales bacterium]
MRPNEGQLDSSLAARRPAVDSASAATLGGGWCGGPDRLGSLAAALVLGDGRFPAGGHAHSGGLEEATTQGLVYDLDSLGAFLVGRLTTVGLVWAALAAGACAIVLGKDEVVEGLRRLDREADARMPSLAQRRISRSQGRQLMRAALVAWPDGALGALVANQPEPHDALAMGATGAAAGLMPDQTAACIAYANVSGPAWAAVRMLGLDPFAVAAQVAALAPVIDRVAAAAAACVPWPGEEFGAWTWMDRLPAASAPLLDHLGESHAARGMRLFAS